MRVSIHRHAAGALAAPLMLAASLLWASPCGAQKDVKLEKAKKHFEEGVRLYKAQVFSLALEEFQKSYKFRPHWVVHYNIGLCYYKMGLYLKAKREFEAYIEKGKQNVEPETYGNIQEVLQRILTVICDVVVKVNVDGAEILVDGAEVGFSPMNSPVEVELGEHSIEVQKEGYLPHKVLFVADKREKRYFVVKLQRDEGSASKETAPTLNAARDWPYFVGMGLGAAFIVVSLGTGITTLQKKEAYSRVKNDYLDLYGGGGATEEDYLAARADMDRIAKDGELYGALTTAFLCAGAVVEAASIALYFLVARKKAETRPSAWNLVPSVHAGREGGYLGITAAF